MTSVLSFAIILIVIVLVHESGHFFTAKAFRIKVLEFGLGFPPRLFSFIRRDTVYSINALPLGGFVKLKGEEDPSDPESLAGKNPLTRLIVLSAGAGANLVLALGIFTTLFMFPQNHIQGEVTIREVAIDSPALMAGLQPGDIVLKVNGKEILNHADLAYRIQLNLGSITHWDILRQQPRSTAPLIGGGDPGLIPEISPANSTTLTLELIPRWRPPEGQGAAGVVISTTSPTTISRSFPIWEAIPNGIVRMGELLKMFRNEIISWIIGAKAPQLAGPVGIAQISGEVARSGWVPLFELTALLSLNLAILNILPIPALDGGRILFVAIEWIRRGKRISAQKEGLVHLIGFSVLISMVVIITYFDIVRLLSGQDILR